MLSNYIARYVCVQYLRSINNNVMNRNLNFVSECNLPNFCKTTYTLGINLFCRRGLYKDTGNGHKEHPDSLQQKAAW